MGKELVGCAVRLHLLLSIHPTPATGPAWQRLASDSLGADVVLTSREKIAYQYLADQVVAAWHAGDQISRWLY
jgi:hypothetical protein